MCVVVIVNKEKEIETPREFLEHFGFEAPKEKYYRTVNMDGCLCQVDVEKALKEHGISYRYDCMRYYVDWK